MVWKTVNNDVFCNSDDLRIVRENIGGLESLAKRSQVRGC